MQCQFAEDDGISTIPGQIVISADMLTFDCLGEIGCSVDNCSRRHPLHTTQLEIKDGVNYKDVNKDNNKYVVLMFFLNTLPEIISLENTKPVFPLQFALSPRLTYLYGYPRTMPDIDPMMLLCVCDAGPTLKCYWFNFFLLGVQDNHISTMCQLFLLSTTKTMTLEVITGV